MTNYPTLSTAYLPPIEYFAFLMQDKVWIETCEHYLKQSYRNRACIMTGNGLHSLVIPVIHSASKMPIKDVRIDYAMPWQKNHWRTILSAYGNSPFFLYYQDALQPFYEKKVDYLLDFNQQLLDKLLSLLALPTTCMPTDHYEPATADDLRYTLNFKSATSNIYPYRLSQPYYQTFEDRFGFIPNLSVLDLIANTGNETLSYIRNFCTFAPHKTNLLSV